MVKNTGSRMTLLACCKQTNNRGNNKGASVIQLIPTIGTVKSVRPPYRIKVKLLTIGGLLAYQPTAVAQDSYKIGTLLPLTGNYGTIGSAMQKSDTLALKHINEAGGIMGHELDLVNRGILRFARCIPCFRLHGIFAHHG
ncbi:MAG: ABC transporter substrate-binding protein [Candidatus Acetothermia bacterium]